jgi:hypothetical protein
MNLYMNRYLALIGGETSTDETTLSSSKRPDGNPTALKEPAEDLPSNGQLQSDTNPAMAVCPGTELEIVQEGDGADGDDAEKSACPNRPLNDVWLFDLMLNVWRQVEPVTKVQSSFNNKKLRKSFEPRMAHSASVLGNYIVVFGGYNS